MPDTLARLNRRAVAAGIDLSGPTASRLVIYFDLLFRWNAKINLTALTDPDAAIDRLLLEPLAAARQLAAHGSLIDLGSGGGSPAIPLAVALSASRVVMVESRTRKAAFLREAARALELSAVVENARFEDVGVRGTYNGRMDLVSIRAVRLDPTTLGISNGFLNEAGRIALFSPTAAPAISLPDDLRIAHASALPGTSHLLVLGHVPRGT